MIFQHDIWSTKEKKTQNSTEVYFKYHFREAAELYKLKLYVTFILDVQENFEHKKITRERSFNFSGPVQLI